ncbi:bifunctional lysylphosphatidylglycerol flippase/synthetase MprF [Rhodococcus sp. NPDC127528]|uniref:bifunctional lysylphosphatidylglycerol flippase/synthetase MprF n=1 Tax=unclassified Rhodococcus (in: high G+C Gram-positive bacteria) TaxID=192944 RepID=UPI00362E803E
MAVDANGTGLVTTAVTAVDRQSRRIVDLVRSGASGAPVSIGALVLIWVLGAATSSLGGPTRYVLRHFAAGIMPFEHGRVWTTLTSGLFAPSLIGYLIATVLIVVVAAPIEHRIGSARFAAAAVCTQVFGTLIALGVSDAVKLVDEGWGFRLHVGAAVSPTTWIAGVVMVASSGMNTLWRRRLRVGLLALLITLALFSGHLLDMVRLSAAVVGLLIGPWIVGRSARGARLTGTQREGRVLVALVVAASALGPVLAALSPNAVGPLAVLRELFRGVGWTPDEVREFCAQSRSSEECRRGLLGLRLGGIGPTLLSLMPSIFLLVLADGLRRGRRFAWIAAVVAQAILLALSLANFAVRFVGFVGKESIFYGLDSPNLYRTLAPFLTPLAILVVLVATRGFFTVSAPRGTYRRLWLLILAVAAVLGVGYVSGAMLAGGGFDRRPGFGSLLVDYPQRLIPPVYLQWLDPQFLPDSAVTTLLYEWTGVLFWTVVCAAVLMTFLTPAYGAATDDAERARALLRSSSGSPLSWMTTWRGNRYWFSPDGTSYVAYRVISGVALTTGDPVGPRERLRENVTEFAEFATGNGWIPCFYSVTGELRAVTDGIGWAGIQVAEETVLRLDGLAFTGKKFQDVRTALNRAKKAGVHAEWISFPSAPLAITDQITAISEEWVADKGMPEMGFTLGGLEEIDDPQVRCLIAVDAERTVHGVTSWMPVYRDGQVVGWTLDFMRRRAEGFRPAMEFLIASAALLLEEEGAEFVSLSGAPLAKVEDPAGASADEEEERERTALGIVMDKVLDVLGRTLEPVYGFRSLLAFKSKFQPEYVPMHMTFADPGALPSIGNAIGRAYLPEVSFGQGMRLVRTMIRS